VIGEGEVAFRTLCESLLTSQRRILTKTVQGGLPPLGELSCPTTNTPPPTARTA
jgi:hypothetical protein